MSRQVIWSEIQAQVEAMGYKLDRELSDGDSSKSKVWLANYSNGTSSERRAVKVSSSLLSDSWAEAGESDGEMIKREKEIYERLSEHPNIPQFKDYMRFMVREVLPVDLLAMEYINAENLDSGIKKRKKLSEEDAVKVLGDALSALSHIHTSLEDHVLHRDIKPSNILFGGDKAFVFDFNFSRIEEGTSASRIIDNGYYPVDAYGGLQTQSHDLVALGNTVICAAYGIDINDLRTKQGKGGLEPISFDDLSFSPKLLSFLRKLTSHNPALRYQNAEQALGDLRNLETITLEEFDGKVLRITRGFQMEMLLKRLSEEDDLFDYNVPSSLRVRFDDGALLEHLEKVYSQKEFVIEDERDVKLFGQIGDEVIMKRDYSRLITKLENGKKGVVNKVDGEKVLVKFPSGKFEISGSDLKPYGVSGFFGIKPRNNDSPNLMVNDAVEYLGPDILDTKESDYIVPAGSRGRIMKKIDDLNAVVWEPRRDLKQTYDYYGSYIKPAVYFAHSDLTIIRPNRINFKRLYEDCFNAALQLKNDIIEKK